MIAIAMPLWRRPDCARAALDALARCDGIGDCVLLPGVEPGSDEVRALVERVDFVDCRPTFRPERLGCGRNAEACWAAGFAVADFGILVEEDVVLAPDALRYFAWCRDRFRDDHTVFSATAYHRRDAPASPGEHHAVRRRAWFHSWGAATWRDRWLATGGAIAAQDAWDGRLLDDFVRGRGMAEVYPELARCQNVGRQSTVQESAEFTPEWYDAHHRLAHWAGPGPPGAGEFREAGGPPGS